MSQAECTDQSSGARYFGKTSPRELKDLEINAARASEDQLAKAASYLEQAFSGMKTAWFGGWALKLRGSRRETHDLDFLVLVSSVVEVRAVLAQYSWAILAFYEIGGVQERMFIDIGERGQLVGVDIILSGAIGTPDLRELASRESISPSFQTPQGNQVNVIHITWQVETKLTAWFSRRKNSDFLDLEFLLTAYRGEIAKWSQFLDKNMRETLYAVYSSGEKNKTKCEAVKKTLSL
ncbi:hypothetical protein N7497_005196 [Penicillium chrysogenum]|uniref:Polymerase nucleotidyl transferase domain-containing protein n=1 Tax=Penicillium chrysogenum TaxID=5076 RepID=A0ABQ8WQC6_PENCH|nr:hypothetical protein N7505_003138 [Penicillium chrysogenum]KAJ5285085.1 hypothetical protein N7524_000391 [Penicillium chrysogenum]KAJ6156311.1 hypothetical protein N7497_005196 [Penicillium chrysogenum]